MDGELESIYQRLVAARTAAEIFGPISSDLVDDAGRAKRTFRRLARLTHPDAYPDSRDKAIATAAFKKLAGLWEEFQDRQTLNGQGTAAGGAGTGGTILKTARREYTIRTQMTRGDLSNLYFCTYLAAGKEQQGIVKIARNEADNALLANEAGILRHLHANRDRKAFFPFVPELVESFTFQDSTSPVWRQANVFPLFAGWYSLKEVREARNYKSGVDPKDMAWIWRRLLVALGFAHQTGVVHGAVLPTHVLIQPEMHGLLLIDWSYAVCDPANSGERIRAISADYRLWYPQEVFRKGVPTPGLDIYMGAECMVYLLGGDSGRDGLAGSVPRLIQNFFRGCILPGASQRPQDAGCLLEEFDEILARLYGPRVFRPFEVPLAN